MECICKFNKMTDIAETSQSGFVDLSDLLSHGYVPPSLNVAPEEFNDIEDPKAVYGRPEDTFHAISLSKTLDARAKAAEAAKKARES